MKNILVLCGGNSFEYDISILSVKNIIKNIDTDLFNFKVVLISKENEWFLNNKKIENIIDFIKGFDLVFPVMHGAFGEDGRIQGFFELFYIPYLGANSSSSKICFDKALTKLILDKYPIKQVPYVIINKGEKVSIRDFPVIVKPANGGSSIGISVANNHKELKNALNEAFAFDDKVVVEKFIKCRELECAIIEDKNLIVSTVGEIESCNKFYDFEAKYEKESNIIIPAKIDKKVIKEIQTASKKIFNILGISGFARIDFLYDEENKELYFNEVNTIPGFTDISMFPLLFKEQKLDFSELITKIIKCKLK